MKIKRLVAKALLKLATWIDPCALYAAAPHVRRMGICIHISKKEIKEYRKGHPECKSYRKALMQMISDARWRVAGSIGKGLMEHRAIHYSVSKTPYVADVGGEVYVYMDEKGDVPE